jgi:hypothetical protein
MQPARFRKDKEAADAVPVKAAGAVPANAAGVVSAAFAELQKSIQSRQALREKKVRDTAVYWSDMKKIVTTYQGPSFKFSEPFGGFYDKPSTSHSVSQRDQVPSPQACHEIRCYLSNCGKLENAIKDVCGDGNCAKYVMQDALGISSFEICQKMVEEIRKNPCLEQWLNQVIQEAGEVNTFSSVDDYLSKLLDQREGYVRYFEMVDFIIASYVFKCKFIFLNQKGPAYDIVVSCCEIFNAKMRHKPIVMFHSVCSWRQYKNYSDFQPNHYEIVDPGKKNRSEWIALLKSFNDE